MKQINLITDCENCGHGDNKMAYAQFWDGNIIDGKNSLKIMRLLKHSNISKPDVLEGKKPCLK